MKLTTLALTEPMKYSLDVENRRRFPASPNYDVLLTVVNPDPDTIQLERSLSNIALGIFKFYFKFMFNLKKFQKSKLYK